MISEIQLRNWADALRSGKYTQGKGKLKTINDEYCCLGLLLELNGAIEKQRTEDYLFNYKGYEDWEVLPTSLASELGVTTTFCLTFDGVDWFSDKNVIFGLNNELRNLATVNDKNENIFPIIGEFIQFLADNYSDFYKYVKQPIC